MKLRIRACRKAALRKDASEENSIAEKKDPTESILGCSTKGNEERNLKNTSFEYNPASVI